MDYKFSKLIQGIQPSMADSMLAQMGDKELISLSGGNPSAEMFPISLIQEISDSLFDKDPVSLLQYSVTEGYKSLRECLKTFFQREETVLKNEDDLIITSGSQQIPDLAARCFCEYGDTVLVEDPSYYLTLDTFRGYGIRLAGVRLEEDGMALADLEDKIINNNPRFLYCIPNFHNPTGITTSEYKRKEIYHICKKYGVLILEDNPYGEIRFEEQGIPSIKSFDDTGLVILARSLSKIIAPGFRISACIANKDILEKFIVAKRCTDVHTGIWGQQVSAQFLQRIDQEKYLSGLRGYYKDKCQFMIEKLKEVLPADVSYIKPRGGMFLWLTLSKRFDVFKVVASLLKKKIAVVPGNIFYVDQNRECHNIRLNFSTPSKEDIEKAIRVLGEVLNS